MKVTREEYNRALDVVEAYQEQIFKKYKNADLRGVGKTWIKDWDKLHLCSKRVQNAFTWSDFDSNFYIEDLTEQEFRTLRNVGKQSWDVVKDLRGY